MMGGKQDNGDSQGASVAKVKDSKIAFVPGNVYLLKNKLLALYPDVLSKKNLV